LGETIRKRQLGKDNLGGDSLGETISERQLGRDNKKEKVYERQ
jgi:hypothetical protein